VPPRPPVPSLAEPVEAFIYVRTDGRAVNAILCDIQCIESQKDCVRIVTSTDKLLLIKQSLSGLPELLPADQFLRIHRSSIVGLRHIQAYNTQHLEVARQDLPVGSLYRKDVQRSIGG
jgi:DNA-binding LytR/AlgR family response regulator